MRIWHISDTHQYHELLTNQRFDSKIDVVIHSGDCSNYRSPLTNEYEILNFLPWFAELPIKHKIYVAGNHDTSIERGLITKKDFSDFGITYLENESITINGIKIWGSPYTPNFGNWAFMKDRSKLDLKVWQYIPEDIHILVTHGPPKGVLDLSLSVDRVLERCGDSALMKRVFKIKPILHLFGHIHNNKDIVNAGRIKLNTLDTWFSNGSVVTDGKFGTLSSNGEIFEI